MSRSTPERSTEFAAFLRGGLSIGLPLGLIFAISSTLEQSGLSKEAFVSRTFLLRLIVAVSIGYVAGGLWELFSTRVSGRYSLTRGQAVSSADRCQFILLEGGVRFGVPLGLFMVVVSILREAKLSLTPLTSAWLIISSVFSLAFFFLVGCAFGFFMWQVAKDD